VRTSWLACVFLAAVALASAADLKQTGVGGRSAVSESAGTDERIASLEKAIAQNPANIAYRNQLAAAYMQKVRETVDFGYLDRAERILNQVLAADDGNYEALRMREVVEMERHHFQTAADFAETIIRLHPADPWSYGILGDASMEMGHYDHAASAYQQMLLLRQDQSSLNRASWYEFVSGRPAQAIALMKQAIDSGARSPENTAWCLVDLGNLYFKTGDIEQAERSYAKALDTFPGYHAAEAGMGRVRGAQGQYAAAIAFYRKAQGSVPLPEYSAALEQLYTVSNQPEEARKQRELIDFVDRMGRLAAEKTNRNLALIYADEGRNLDRALELIQEELKVRNDIFTHDALAWVLFQRKDYAGAEESARVALELGTTEPAFYYHAGRIAAAQGKPEEARKLLSRALELNPKFDLRQAPLATDMLHSLKP
jgi:tetratricopeptide (TPR) repeat protein